MGPKSVTTLPGLLEKETKLIDYNDGPYCDRETCNKAMLIGEQSLDGERWFEYSCDECTYYFMKRVPVARKTHLKLLEHQLEAARALGNGKVLWGGVGSGKSITALYYYMQKETPRPLYVITTAKKRESKDWDGEAAKIGIGEEHDATIAGVLTVDSWQSIKKYVDVEDAFFSFDEQRLVGTGSWYKAFIKIAKNNHWIMLSATPGDTWMDYIALFVANGFVKNITQFKQDHVLNNSFTKYPKVERYRQVGKLIRWRNDILVHMPYQKHTKRHIHVVDVEHDSDVAKQVLEKRWHVYEDRPLNNIAEMFLVLRKVNNSDPSRLEVIRCLMEKHPKLIIFYNFNFELEILRELAFQTMKSMDVDGHTIVQNEKERLLGTSPMSSDAQIAEATHLCTSPKATGWKSTGWKSTLTSNHGSETKSDTSSEKNSIERRSSVTKRPLTTSQSTTTSTVSGMKKETGGSLEDLTEQSGTQTTQSFAIAEWNGQKHQEIPKTDRWVYLVQYTAGSEGWNCVETDAIALYSLSYSYKATHQSMGRIDRLNTPYTDLHYYILKSNSFIDDAVWKSLKSKKSFNESSYAASRGW